MYNLLSAAIGVLVAIMITFNGMLSKGIGNNWATVIIHIVGFIGIGLILILKKKRIDTPKGIPLVWYTAGAIGVFTVMSTNLTFNYLGASVTFALSLLGQCTASIVVDHFGLLGMERIRLNKKKLIGVSVIALGIVIMMIG
jgi:transporter family-2 protein